MTHHPHTKFDTQMQTDTYAIHEYCGRTCGNLFLIRLYSAHHTHTIDPGYCDSRGASFFEWTSSYILVSISRQIVISGRVPEAIKLLYLGDKL